MINTDTSLFAVLGDPVSHSLSPVMHNSAFSHIGYNGIYLAFNVKDIKAAVAGIRGLGIRGASITIPHKVSVMKYLDQIDPMAQKIGAVNTIINKNGLLTGYNTDYSGALMALLEKTTIKNKDVVIIGAGGAARAIGFGILKEGGNLTIINILEDEGSTLAKDLGVNYYHLSQFNEVINKSDCKILINTTPVGMTPNEKEMPVESKYLNREMVVMDIVYNPLKTRFLKEAEKIGCKTINGAAMFVFQGVFQFELWTQKKAPVDIMKKVVLYALKKGK